MEDSSWANIRSLLKSRDIMKNNKKIIENEEEYQIDDNSDNADRIVL